MSGHPDKSFSETEKVVLLAEIIKSSNIPSAALLHLITTYQVEPEWTEIQRPSGRLLRDCQRAFSELRSAPPPSPYTIDPRHDLAAAYQARPQYQEAGSSIGRSIVPRPQGMAPGVFPPPTPYASPAAAEPPRKRGRPSNADLEARRQRAEALGEPYPQPSRSKAKGKTTSRLSIPPSGSQPPTPVQSEPPTAVTNPGTSANTPSLQPQLSRLNTASASPVPHSGESTKRPRPHESAAEERQAETQHTQPEARRTDAPPSRGPRFPSADVFHSSQEPWSSTSSPQSTSYPQRSLPPTQPPSSQAIASAEPTQLHSGAMTSGRMSPPRPPERR